MKIKICDICKNIEKKSRNVCFRVEENEKGYKKDVPNEHLSLDLCVDCEIKLLRQIISKINQINSSSILITKECLNKMLNKEN